MNYIIQPQQAHYQTVIDPNIPELFGEIALKNTARWPSLNLERDKKRQFKKIEGVHCRKSLFFSTLRRNRHYTQAFFWGRIHRKYTTGIMPIKTIKFSKQKGAVHP